MAESSIRIPATTANLGPGFDCLGAALQVFNTVHLTNGSGESSSHPMTEEVGNVFFPAASMDPFPFQWSVEGDVPRSRGMGSSVTVRLGILHGLNVLAGKPLDDTALFELCAGLEGHPDNAAPAAFGGFVVCGGGKISRFEISPELRFVLLIPDFEVSTPHARSVLPATIDRKSAVVSCGNACRIVAAFATANYALLRGAFGDGLHQPFREPLVPFLGRVIAAGEGAGALGGFLSGSGSTICCVTLEAPDAVGAAMFQAAECPGARVRIVGADNVGVQVL